MEIVLKDYSSLGLVKDAKILNSELKFKIVTWKQMKSDKVIFLEHINPDAKYTLAYFIPNPEMLTDWDIKFLPKINMVLCKTYNCLEIMKRYTSNVKYIGFTSIIKPLEEKKDYKLYGHFAGSSYMKNTISVLRSWIKSSLFNKPGYQLIVTRNPKYKTIIDNEYINELKKFDKMVKKNIKILTFIDESEYEILRYKCGIHICPSLIEGYGHYINEARAVRSIVITTDASPMKELIKDDFYRIPVVKKIPINKVITNRYLIGDAILNYVDENLLTKKIEDVSKLSNPEQVGEENYYDYNYDKDRFIKNIDFLRTTPKTSFIVENNTVLLNEDLVGPFSEYVKDSKLIYRTLKEGRLEIDDRIYLPMRHSTDKIEIETDSEKISSFLTIIPPPSNKIRIHNPPIVNTNGLDFNFAHIYNQELGWYDGIEIENIFENDIRIQVLLSLYQAKLDIKKNYPIYIRKYPKGESYLEYNIDGIKIAVWAPVIAYIIPTHTEVSFLDLGNPPSDVRFLPSYLKSLNIPFEKSFTNNIYIKG